MRAFNYQTLPYRDAPRLLCVVVVQESFRVTRMAFSSLKMKVRSSLAISHNGPGTLDEAVQGYIDRHRAELYETADLVDVRIIHIIIIIIITFNRRRRYFVTATDNL